jgi:SSS family solute:Na+ symporter
MVPLYQHAQSIIDLLQRLNGLYSMPVLAIFIVAVLFSHVDGRAARAGLVFGAALYAVFTFVWSPLHYIHLMFVTLVASVVFILLLSKLLQSRRALQSAPAQ